MNARSLVVSVAAAVSLIACHRAVAPERLAPASVDAYRAGAGGILANAYLVETPEGVVVVDGTLTVSDGKALRAKVDATGKPLVAVLLTHGHPDHYNGVTYVVEGTSAPVISTVAVDQVIREHDAAKEAQWSGMFGAEWPKQRTFPTRTVEDGATLTLAGVRFTVQSLGAGESHADSYWVLESASGREAFVGDAVLNQVHAYTSDGHTAAWLQNLARLEQQLQGVQAVHPGHGPSGGLEMLRWQRDYLEAYRAALASIAGGRPSLTTEEKQQLTARMKAYLPEGALDFLVGLGADAVAQELASAE